MKCDNCGRETTHVRICYSEGKRQEICDYCGGLNSKSIPDVWCPVGGYFDENLADTAHPKGQYVNDKRHKAELLQKLNLRERGTERNPVTGKVTPYFNDVQKRRKYCLDNFGG